MKIYTIKLTETALKCIKKLGKSEQEYIMLWIKKNLVNAKSTEEQLHKLKPLKKELKGSYKVKIGKYRLICDLNNNDLIILILKIGNRKNVYK